MKIIAFVVALVLFVGGLYIMGNAFSIPGFEPYVFVGGILLVAVSLAIPFHVMKRLEG